MRTNQSCKVLCKRTLSKDDKDIFKSMIDSEYQVNWIVDNLPAATRYVRRGATSLRMGVCVLLEVYFACEERYPAHVKELLATLLGPAVRSLLSICSRIKSSRFSIRQPSARRSGKRTTWFDRCGFREKADQSLTS